MGYMPSGSYSLRAANQPTYTHCDHPHHTHTQTTQLQPHNSHPTVPLQFGCILPYNQLQTNLLQLILVINMILTKQDLRLFNKLIFEPCHDSELLRLTDQHKQHLRLALAQKIAYEAVYRKSYRQVEVELPENYYRTPSFLSYVCCCFYPEYYKDSFSLTASLFRKRLFGTCLFWREDFLLITEAQNYQPKLLEQQKRGQQQKRVLQVRQSQQPSFIPQLVEVKQVRRQVVVVRQKEQEYEREQRVGGVDLYGPLWLCVTYMILLALCANLNQYFSSGSNPNFAFKKDYLSSALAFTAFIRLAEIITYPAIVGCLDGQMSYTESAYLVGYSLALYFLPTALCAIASQSVHTLSLLAAAVLRSVFLCRNYTSRVMQRKGVVYMVVVVFEAFYYFVVSSTFFSSYYAGQPAVVASAHLTSTHFLRTFGFHQ